MVLVAGENGLSLGGFVAREASWNRWIRCGRSLWWPL